MFLNVELFRDAIIRNYGAEWTRNERSIIRYFRGLSSDHFGEILKASWKPSDEKEIPPSFNGWHEQIGMGNIEIAARSTSFWARCRIFIMNKKLRLSDSRNAWKDDEQNQETTPHWKQLHVFVAYKFRDDWHRYLKSLDSFIEFLIKAVVQFCIHEWCIFKYLI